MELRTAWTRVTACPKVGDHLAMHWSRERSLLGCGRAHGQHLTHVLTREPKWRLFHSGALPCLGKLCEGSAAQCELPFSDHLQLAACLHASVFYRNAIFKLETANY